MKHYPRSPQQKIHWEKLTLLGMCGQMVGTLWYINRQTGFDVMPLRKEVFNLQLKIESVYSQKLKEQKHIDQLKKNSK